MGRLGVLLVVALVALPGCAAGGQPQAAAASSEPIAAPTLAPSEPFHVAEVTLRGPEDQELVIPVYVADTPQERAHGLMHREDLPDGTGMVFVFPDERRGAFYMYQTLMPLTIAFAGADGRIRALLDMEPCTSSDPAACERYDPGVSYAAALEVEQGLLGAHDVTTDWTMELPPDLRADS